MSRERVIPVAVRQVQIQASDPAASAWVAANAGSGKTHVLTQRVIRLLLDGVPPEKVLCLTFTKAAAANMSNRVFGTLAQWTSLGDAELTQAIRETGVSSVDAGRLAAARRLFASALETPGGLKVQTIHAFCTRLLHQFPFEANVAARFTVLDESSETQLLDQLSLAVLLEAAASPEGALGRALATAITAAADQTFRDVVNEAIARRDTVRAWTGHTGSLQAVGADLSHAFGIDPDDTAARIETELFAETLIRVDEWPTTIAAIAEGSTNDQKLVERIETMRAAPDATRARDYRAIFCTAELEPRKNLITRAIQGRHPQLFQRLLAEQERVCRLIERDRAVACRDRTAALLTIADAVLSRFEREKQRRGLLDYDDLIDHTLRLFRNVSASWVLYKLDLGIDHVLIDEAQDTSPKQWDIVMQLVSEFAAGEGARGGTKRTIFAVGDEKQSIFSFQGAVPHKFAEMQRYFRARFEAAQLVWRPIRLHHSFRSGANVLSAVDHVFREPHIFASVTSDEAGIPAHEALPGTAPGLVEIWPLIKAEKPREIEGWDAPFDEVTEASPQVRLASKIAGSIRRWLGQGTRAGDILILVRQRGALFETIIRALKELRIPVAGADRLVLTQHIAVMDLMVLADALLMPGDDLALATVLRSPLFGLTDDQLFDLAWGRPGSLRAALRTKAEGDPLFARASRLLDRFAAWLGRETPFAFYARVLGPEGGRHRFLARLGEEANDALDEFLNLALDYESREPPSLQGFVAWLRTARAEVKRDMEIARDEVRVMTVHGAKGLEAPTVILADTTTRPTGPRDPRLLALPAARAAPGTPDRLVWAGSKLADIGPVRDARERARGAAQDEYRRLLYVAMTRAAERLIVCGTEGQQKRPDGCWYDLVAEALTAAAIEEPADDGDGMILRYRMVTPASDRPVRSESAGPDPHAPELPDWLHRPAPAAPLRTATLAPSHPHETGGRTAPSMPPNGAVARGRLVHRLMQALPELPPERRADAARRHCDRLGAIAGAEPMVARLLRLFDDPRFAALFASGSRAEVPIVGRLPGFGEPILVSGQVDRLAITSEAVLIADYKTNSPPPATVAQVPGPYITQLALYRAVLRQLYPDRTVRTALIWTEGPDLMEISDAALDRALAAVTSA